MLSFYIFEYLLYHHCTCMLVTPKTLTFSSKAILLNILPHFSCGYLKLCTYIHTVLAFNNMIDHLKLQDKLQTTFKSPTIFSFLPPPHLPRCLLPLRPGADHPVVVLPHLLPLLELQISPALQVLREALASHPRDPRARGPVGASSSGHSHRERLRYQRSGKPHEA